MGSGACRVPHDAHRRLQHAAAAEYLPRAAQPQRPLPSHLPAEREGGDRNVAAEHTEIATLAVQRDIEPACDSLRDHIQRTGTNLYNYLSQSTALATLSPRKAS